MRLYKKYPRLLMNIYSTTNGEIFIRFVSYLFNVYLCCLVSYTYDVGTTSKRYACAIVSNFTLVNEFTID